MHKVHPIQFNSMIRNKIINIAIAISASMLLVQCGTEPPHYNPNKGSSDIMPLDPAIKHGIKEVGAVSRFKAPDNWEITRHEEDARGYVYTCQ